MSKDEDSTGKYKRWAPSSVLLHTEKCTVKLKEYYKILHHTPVGAYCKQKWCNSTLHGPQRK